MKHASGSEKEKSRMCNLETRRGKNLSLGTIRQSLPFRGLSTTWVKFPMLPLQLAACLDTRDQLSLVKTSELLSRRL